MSKPATNTICLWYNRDAEEATRFYAETFSDSPVDAVHGCRVESVAHHSSTPPDAAASGV